MRIVDAVWEKRNLGIKALEISIENGDKLEEIVEKLSNLSDEEYIVIKVPVGRVDLSFELSKLGYTFIETMNYLVHDMKIEKLSDEKEKKIKDVKIETMNVKDVSNLFDRINDGIFQTDRISLDPHFSLKQSANRFIEWIKDEINKGSELKNIFFRNKNIGFVALRKTGENIYSNFLMSIYPEFQGNGYGSDIVYQLVSELKTRGVSSIYTYVSSNNVASLMTHVKHGYVIKNSTYIYVKHNESERSEK